MLESLKDVPVVNGEGGGTVEPEVAVKMKITAAGLNAGEVGRFSASAAAAMIEKGEAGKAAVQPEQAMFAEKVKRAHSLIHRALDMREAVAVQLGQVKKATTDAIESVEFARALQKDRGESFTTAREILEAKSREAEDREAGTIKEKEAAVASAKKAEEAATKAVKRAKNKDAAHAKVAAAEEAASAAQQDLASVTTSIDAMVAIRAEAVSAAIQREQAALNQDVDSGMEELEAKLKELE